MSDQSEKHSDGDYGLKPVIEQMERQAEEIRLRHRIAVTSAGGTNAEPPKQRDTDGLHRRRGIWYYCLTIAGKRRFFSTKTRNYKEARKAKFNAIKTQLENRLPTDLAKWPFEKLLIKRLADRKLNLAENSVRLEKERSTPLLKYFSGRRISEIDADAIRAYQIARKRTVGNRTINLECKLLRNVLYTAKTWGTISDDFRDVDGKMRFFLKEDRRGPGRALEDTQEKLLFDTARSRPEWDAAFYAAMIAANTTMRGVEIKNLKLQDVNLVDRMVYVGISKTDPGIRPIPLNGGAMWAFARVLERANALGSTNPAHYLFPRFLSRQTNAPDLASDTIPPSIRRPGAPPGDRW
jgi:integrase